MGENMAANLEVIPTGNALGAEVCGVDLSKNLPDALVGKLTDVWAQHLVLLFRDQEMTDDLIIKMADYFGGHQAGGARMRRRAVGLQEYGQLRFQFGRRRQTRAAQCGDRQFRASLAFGQHVCGSAAHGHLAVGRAGS
jgi:alpha-ketoglutarate-dependent taurine dioxygenase